MGAAGIGSAGSSAPGRAGSIAVPAAGTGGSGAAGGTAGGTAGAAGGAGAGMAGGAAGAAGMAGSGGEPVDPNACAVGPIPAGVRQEYRFDAFYTRYASAAGVPVVASDSPEDEALRRTCLIVLDLSSGPANVRPSMLENHIYFILIGADETTASTPEFRSSGVPDSRARGLGSTNYAVCAEESVMCDRTTDRWRGESICVHEYSHTFHNGVFRRVDSMFQTKLSAAFDNARSNGLWSNTYADDNAAEYFAEGVQSWYNTNQVPSRTPTDGVHNAINTKDELEEYDPMLYELLAGVLPAVPGWKDCYHYDR